MSTSGYAFGHLPPNSKPVVHAKLPAGIGLSAELFDRLAHDLQFPGYFGRNWDALEDCMRDLSWLPPGQIVVEHSDVPLMNNLDDAKIYLSVLDDAIEKFSRSSDRSILVIFPAETADDVAQLRGSYLPTRPPPAG